MTQITIAAPAKINLFLHVVGRRADGYHLLDSLVAFADYGDVIEVEQSPDISLEITGEYAAKLALCPKENNLVWKAAAAFQKYSLKPVGAKITLTKNLPVASGIGGGSADAAAAIIALKKLWELDITEQELSKIAVSLGSDVPVCLYGKPAIMRGVGEEITPLVLQGNAYIVLINPNLPLDTAEIFREFARGGYNYSAPVLAYGNNWHDYKDEFGFKNDLELVARAKLPIITEILMEIADTEGCFIARMSGSGATCFGLYNDGIAAQKAAGKLKVKFPQAWCVSAKILS